MKILGSYIHGSEDSLDRDVVYIVDELPTFTECQEFCSGHEEDRNLMVIKDGTVDGCFKGLPDELNNEILVTYSLHDQSFPLLITRKVERDIILRDIRAVRSVISLFTRTTLRKEAKSALRGCWDERVSLLGKLDLIALMSEWTEDSSPGLEDTLKSIAFQLGQASALHDGAELFTKRSISEAYPVLRPYLYREKNPDLSPLQEFLRRYAEIIEKNEDVGLLYDLKEEKRRSED